MWQNIHVGTKPRGNERNKKVHTNRGGCCLFRSTRRIVRFVGSGSSATTAWISPRRRRQETRLVAWSESTGGDDATLVRRWPAPTRRHALHSTLRQPRDSGVPGDDTGCPFLLTTFTQTSKNVRYVGIHGAMSKLLTTVSSVHGHTATDNQHRRQPVVPAVDNSLQRSRHSQNAPILHDLAPSGAHDDIAVISSLNAFTKLGKLLPLTRQLVNRTEKHRASSHRIPSVIQISRLQRQPRITTLTSSPMHMRDPHLRNAIGPYELTYLRGWPILSYTDKTLVKA